MPRSDAREAILSHWISWSHMIDEEGAFPRAGTAMHLFYEYLKAHYPEVLDFSSYSPYLEMRQWLAEDCEP